MAECSMSVASEVQQENALLGGSIDEQRRQGNVWLMILWDSFMQDEASKVEGGANLLRIWYCFGHTSSLNRDRCLDIP